LQRLEATLGTAVLETHRGGAARGGARLTPAARHLVAVYRTWREEVEAASQEAFARAVARLSHQPRIARRRAPRAPRA
jgi:molybdate transport repressor ModE-like protein